MAESSELEQALAALTAAGRVEVRENGRWLAALASLQYEVRQHAGGTLIHLWSDERNLVRRVLRVAEQSQEHVVLEVQRFGRGKPDTLEFVRSGRERPENRVTRENFLRSFRDLLMQQFPDEQIDSLSTASDAEHSLSGCYTRGLVHRGQRARAVIVVSSAENAATIDSILTYGLIWLDRAKEHAGGQIVAGLRVFLPENTSRLTAHRLQVLEPSTHIELYEVNEARWRAQAVDARDIGNLAAWLTPRRELEHVLIEAAPAVGRIRHLAPDAIGFGVPPGTRDVALRFRGLELARWHAGKVSFGLGEDRRELTQQNWPDLEALVRELETFRHPLAADTAHPLYRIQAERWLEAMVQADPARIDPRLDPRFLYAQVPAFAGGDRGVLDLLGVTRDARLAVMELKAGEDIDLALQAVDYWLRVRWHHAQEDFQRYGYFAGLELQKKPPLLFLVAPGFRFHPATEVILRYVSHEVEVLRVGLNESWRRGLRVLFRQ